MPFADLHENSLVVHTGMNQSTSEGSAVALTFDNMKNASFNVNYSVSGNPVKADNNSMLGFKIDFRTDKGYEKSVFYSLKGINGAMSIPLGKGAIQDETVEVADNLGNCKITLNERAPANWDGRIMITFVVNNCGKGSTAKYILSNS